MKYFLPFLITIPLFFSSCGKKKETTHPEFRELTESVYASGNILPEHTYTLYALADGYLTHRNVHPGDSIYTQQVLFELQSDQQSLRVQTARSNYETARSNADPVLAELEASLRSARARLQNDSLLFVRYQNLLDKNAVPRVEYERIALQYKTAANEYQALQSRYRKTRLQMQNELTNARNQYKLNTVEESNYQLTSRLNGRVYDVFKEEGELVRRGEPVALLGDSHDLYLRLSVDELDISKIRTGQQVLVRLDTYADTVWRATVTKVYPTLNPRDRTFRVDAHFPHTIPLTYNGLTAEANIVVRQNPKALVIPKAFLIGKDSVAVQQDGDVKTVHITRGVENMEYVEILSGLDTSSTVIKQ